MEKEIHIYWEKIEDEAMRQFNEVMKIDSVIKWVLLPDAHSGYVLPIWGVVAVKDYIFPAFIWYDIGCGVCAIKTEYKKKQIKGLEDRIFDSVYRSVPCWEWLSRKEKIDWDYLKIPHSNFLENLMKTWIYQIWTLGWWNHFIEISYDEEDNIWIVVHSWSRWVWYKTAAKYMRIAKMIENPLFREFEKEFEEIEDYEKLKKKDIEEYEEIKWKYIFEKWKKLFKWGIEWTYGLKSDSKEWKEYIMDMNFCLEFALENRKQMLKATYGELDYYLSWKRKEINYENMINRHHNHAELKDSLWIHRKWATHAERWMLWIIPWNMRDWSFVVRWKWNPDSLYSSSHWWGRIMSRTEAKRSISLDEFKETMKWIKAKVDFKTIDEAPFAYKNIFEVMKFQKDMVQILHHLKPIINIKG
ncbi:MAG: hypothetical protein ACD_4C00238G0002 [uncultured bacterium (gcode 4)]|uniref:3'-phosphate/5'-hydroxy nucleic acid ligase n=1 Tax=uncultured bacterium (gcode 4) TaxID=1234023 RepID=K2FUH7_9BACT|nr:MAG: hypothetical protein ACD_4C00238G0002 [uncultured bacterium (gcode 4)]